MQAFEATGSIDAQGQLSLDQPLEVTHPGRVRIIVLLTESSNQTPEQTKPNLTSSQTVRENDQAFSNVLWGKTVLFRDNQRFATTVEIENLTVRMGAIAQRVQGLPINLICRNDP